jgi:hypothetical protein
MARQFWFRPMNEEAQAARGWSDLFNRIFSDLGPRFSVGGGSVPSGSRPVSAEIADLIPAAAGFELTPTPGATPTPAPVLPAFPLAPASDPLTSFGPVAGQPGAAVAVMGGPPGGSLGNGGGPGALGYVVLFSDDLSPGLIVDLSNREIIPDGTRYLDLGGGAGDVLVLAGPLARPSGLPAGLVGLENVVVTAGASYVLIATDDHVAPGATLEVNAMGLGADDAIAFDGSAESSGRFLFLGGEGGDIFVGGAGHDLIFGHGGGDVLAGGGGADRFGYADASESSGLAFDVLFDFEPGEDRIDLPVTVTGFDPAIETGSLSEASFDEDLGAALGGLGAGRAIFFRPDSGDLAGVIFLVVDANGEEGYQAGEDFVFALPTNDLPDLSAHTGFFV